MDENTKEFLLAARDECLKHGLCNSDCRLNGFCGDAELELICPVDFVFPGDEK